MALVRSSAVCLFRRPFTASLGQHCQQSISSHTITSRISPASAAVPTPESIPPPYVTTTPVRTGDKFVFRKSFAAQELRKYNELIKRKYTPRKTGAVVFDPSLFCSLWSGCAGTYFNSKQTSAVVAQVDHRPSLVYLGLGQELHVLSEMTVQERRGRKVHLVFHAVDVLTNKVIAVGTADCILPKEHLQ